MVVRFPFSRRRQPPTMAVASSTSMASTTMVASGAPARASSAAIAPRGPAAGQQLGQLVVDEVAGRVAVGGLAHRHQQGGPQGLVGPGRQVDHEGGQAGADRLPGRVRRLDLDRQGQDDAGAVVGEPRRQGDLAALQALGGAGGDRGHLRPELVQRLDGGDRAGGGQQAGQLRAGVDRLAEPRPDYHVERPAPGPGCAP